VFAQLKTAHATLAAAPPVDPRNDPDVVDARRRLNAHRAFMHTPLAHGLSPFGLLAARAALREIEGITPLTAAERERVDPAHLSEARRLLHELALIAPYLLRQPDVPWSQAAITPEAVPAAVEHVRSDLAVLEEMVALFERLGLRVTDRTAFTEGARDLRSTAVALAVVTPEVFAVAAWAIAPALAATASPWSAFLAVFSPQQRAALRAIRAMLVSASERASPRSTSTPPGVGANVSSARRCRRRSAPRSAAASSPRGSASAVSCCARTRDRVGPRRDGARIVP
jgi:hypothetical protein